MIVNTYNDHHYLAQAIGSIRAQTVAASEIIIVDDGSREDPAPQLRELGDLKLIRQQNAGLAAARNSGLAAASGEYILFLDADDRLLPGAIEHGLETFAAHPDAALVYGAHRRIADDGTPLGPDRFSAVGPAPFEDLLRGNVVAMHAAVLYRTSRLHEIGGFDPSLRRCEDYDLYLRVARTGSIACHPAVVAEYRWHGANMSHDVDAMLNTVLQVSERHRDGCDRGELRAWREGRRNWRDYYAREQAEAALRLWRQDGSATAALRTARQATAMSPVAVLKRTGEGVITVLKDRLKKHLPGVWPPRRGKVRLGHLASTRPVSEVFGYDRGLPVDRHYIEAFLAKHSADIRGNVLEIGDDDYSRRFGSGIDNQDILHVHAGNPIATLVGDLCDPAVVRDDSFDCMILTQTLHLIYDFRLALERTHAALKPGGVVLLTVPGITRIDRDEWGTSWYWSFTQHALTRLFSDTFGEESYTLDFHGNVFAATAFLHGLALEEVDQAKLAVVDPAYPVILGVRAVKR